MRQPLLTKSLGIKLSPSLYEAFETRASAQGVKVSEYARQILLRSLQQPIDNNNQIRAQLSLLEEVLALRSIVVNVASEQASGVPLTAERLQAVRAYADAHKAARARTLLAESGSNNKLAVVSEHEEAA